MVRERWTRSRALAVLHQVESGARVKDVAPGGSFASVRRLLSAEELGRLEVTLRRNWRASHGGRSCQQHEDAPEYSAVGNRHPLHRTWANMRARCEIPSTKQFQDYGGRGIKVCNRWRCFWCFVTDMGSRPTSHSLDRIDPDGNYEPANCRWSTAKEQANRENQRHGYRLKKAEARIAAYEMIYGKLEVAA